MVEISIVSAVTNAASSTIRSTSAPSGERLEEIGGDPRMSSHDQRQTSAASLARKLCERDTSIWIEWRWLSRECGCIYIDVSCQSIRKVLTFQQMAFLENQVPKLKSKILLTKINWKIRKPFEDIQKIRKPLEEIRKSVEKIRNSVQNIGKMQ